MRKPTFAALRSSVTCCMHDNVISKDKLQKHQNWQKSCLCHGWYSARVSRSKDQRSRSPGRLTPWLKISHIFEMGRPASHHLQESGSILWRPHYRPHSLLCTSDLSRFTLYRVWFTISHFWFWPLWPMAVLCCESKNRLFDRHSLKSRPIWIKFGRDLLLQGTRLIVGSVWPRSNWLDQNVQQKSFTAY